ncbi:MAG: sensor histidine kinase [Verrucomicrobiales bacterium]
MSTPGLQLSFILLVLCSTGRGLCAAPLTKVGALRELGFHEAAAGREVQLTGVVTYLRDAPGASAVANFNFNLNDETGGVMVYPSEHVRLAPGQEVEVRGVTAMSVHGLRIEKAVAIPGPMKSLPEAVAVSMAALREGGSEGMFVEMDAIVRVARLESPEISPQRLALDFGPRSRRITAWITRFDEARGIPTAGTMVRLRGVPVRWTNARGQAQGLSLMVNSTDDIEALMPPGEPQSQNLEELQLWSGPDEPARLRKTGGVVTLARPGHLLVVQEGDRAMRFRPAPLGALDETGLLFPLVGDRVTVTGFPVLGEYTTELEEVLVLSAEPDVLPTAEAPVDAAAMLAGKGLVDRDGRLFTLRGHLREIQEREDLRLLEMDSGSETFTAVLPREFPLPEGTSPGAELGLTGVCALHLTEERRRLGRSPDQFSLLLPNGSAVELVRAPSWWTLPRLLGALGVIAAVALLAAFWAVLMAGKNARLKAEIGRREEAERRLATDRRRVAGDLHDTLEQTLLAAGLQLNAAGRTLATQPEAAADRVALAHQLIARGRQEVRDAVWDLHASGDQVQSLAALLGTACSEAGSSTSAVVTFSVEGPERPVPAQIMAQCIRLVREAVSNAIKHGSPRQIGVTLRFGEGELRLTVADDGSGFVSGSAPGPETGHFGLAGMKERALRLGGALEVNTQPGQGTTLTAMIPLPT